MGGEDDELAALLAAWCGDIGSVPAPAMLELEVALMVHADSPVLSALRPTRVTPWYVGPAVHPPLGKVSGDWPRCNPCRPTRRG